MGRIPAVPPELPVEGTVLGDSRILIGSCLGKGAMGAVFKGVQPGLDRQVAVKLLLKSGVGMRRSEAVARLRDEAVAAARVNHHGLVQIICVDEDEEYGPFIVYEYVAGGNLRAFLDKSGRQDFRWLMEKLARPILGALDALHSAGVIHRDVKPENLVCSQDGLFKLADLGLAFFDGRFAGTGEGLLIGSPGYMAPERITAADASPTACSDLYSAAAVFVEVLSGRLLFTGANPVEVLRRQLEKPVFSFELKGMGIEPPLAAIFSRCLSIDPKQRPAKAALLLQELEDLFSAGHVIGGYTRDSHKTVKVKRGVVSALSAVEAKDRCGEKGEHWAGISRRRWIFVLAGLLAFSLLAKSLFNSRTFAPEPGLTGGAGGKTLAVAVEEKLLDRARRLLNKGEGVPTLQSLRAFFSDLEKRASNPSVEKSLRKLFRHSSALSLLAEIHSTRGGRVSKKLAVRLDKVLKDMSAGPVTGDIHPYTGDKPLAAEIAVSRSATAEATDRLLPLRYFLIEELFTQLKKLRLNELPDLVDSLFIREERQVSKLSALVRRSPLYRWYRLRLRVLLASSLCIRGRAGDLDAAADLAPSLALVIGDPRLPAFDRAELKKDLAAIESLTVNRRGPGREKSREGLSFKKRIRKALEYACRRTDEIHRFEQENELTNMTRLFLNVWPGKSKGLNHIRKKVIERNRMLRRQFWLYDNIVACTDCVESIDRERLISAVLAVAWRELSSRRMLLGNSFDWGPGCGLESLLNCILQQLGVIAESGKYAAFLYVSTRVFNLLKRYQDKVGEKADLSGFIADWSRLFQGLKTKEVPVYRTCKAIVSVMKDRPEEAALQTAKAFDAVRTALDSSIDHPAAGNLRAIVYNVCKFRWMLLIEILKRDTVAGNEVRWLYDWVEKSGKRRTTGFPVELYDLALTFLMRVDAGELEKSGIPYGRIPAVLKKRWAKQLDRLRSVSGMMKLPPDINGLLNGKLRLDGQMKKSKFPWE